MIYICGMDSEQLRPQEFDVHIAEGTLRLSFVGMSNGGKSYRSKVLRNDEQFLWYHVDEHIQKALGFDDMGAMSSWLGYPTDEYYSERERHYLELEDRFTKNASLQTNGQNLVFDTTGSVVHLPPETLSIVKETCLVVHLDVGEESLEHLIEQFFKEPKPVAWFGHYEGGESQEEALRHSYPKLLAARLQKYRELAHINIAASELRDKTGAETLAVIRNHLA